MGELFITFSIFIAVLSISLLLFGGWVTVVAARGITRVFTLIFNDPLPINHQTSATDIYCSQCHQSNPTSARYCRRCGNPTSQTRTL